MITRITAEYTDGTSAVFMNLADVKEQSPDEIAQAETLANTPVAPVEPAPVTPEAPVEVPVVEPVAPVAPVEPTVESEAGEIKDVVVENTDGTSETFVAA